ncbi:hypothetical protein [Kitasatospora sp. NPDC002040]|uniref:hypothetical protein n=1 Tax=Kitasatospora sp. NPDC002040 TaxID=3154661 RepID=UPI00332CFC65
MGDLMNEESAVHGLLDRALDQVEFPAVDPVAAVRARAQTARRRRRGRRALSAAVGAVVLAGAVLAVPSLRSDRESTPLRTDDRYYPVGTLLPADVSGLRVAELPGGPVESGPPNKAVRGTTYTFDRKGRSGFLEVNTVDPARGPGAPDLSEMFTGCPTALPPSRTCWSSDRHDGSVLEVSTVTSSSRAPQGEAAPWFGPVVGVTILYRDGRLVQLNAVTALGSPAPVTDPPLLTEGELIAMAGSQAWFGRDSVG